MLIKYLNRLEINKNKNGVLDFLNTHGYRIQNASIPLTRAKYSLDYLGKCILRWFSLIVSFFLRAAQYSRRYKDDRLTSS